MSMEGDTRMHSDRPCNRAHAAFWIVALGLILPCDVMAYIDPGTSGLLSQVLYVMFYGALGVFFYMHRYIKQYVAQVKRSVAKVFARF